MEVEAYGVNVVVVDEGRQKKKINTIACNSQRSHVLSESQMDLCKNNVPTTDNRRHLPPSNHHNHQTPKKAQETSTTMSLGLQVCFL
jgi:hypothetical protein